jgi:hypothetical protein
MIGLGTVLEWKEFANGGPSFWFLNYKVDEVLTE